MHAYEPYLKKIIPWGLFLLALLFYTNNLAPTIAWRDAPEFVTVSHNLDISHPAGSPTYSLSSKLLTFVPIGNIALRVNLFSSIMSSICVALIFILLYEVLDGSSAWQKLIASVGGSLSLVASNAFWSFSEIAEVYTFQNFFLLLLLLILIKSHSADLLSKLHYKYSFAFLYGLSLGVHATMIIFSPAFIIYALVSDKDFLRLKYLVFTLCFAIFGFVVYIYLPFRSVSPIAFDWGDPETFSQFLVQIFDRKDSINESHALINLSVFKFKLYIDHLINEFSILLFLIGIVGFLGLLASRFSLAMLLFTVFISNIIFFLHAGWTVSWGYIPSFVIFSIFIGNGIYLFNEVKNLSYHGRILYKIPKKLILFTNLLVLLVLVIFIKNNFALALKDDYSAKFFGKKMLAELPSDAVLFSEYMWFPLLYLQQIERRRPDLTVILQGEVFFPEYFETISEERFPNIKHVKRPVHDKSPAYDFFWELSKLNAVDHPLFWEPDSQFQELISDHIIPRGMLFLFDPDSKKKITKDEMNQHNTSLQRLVKYEMPLINDIEGKRFIANKMNYIANFWAKLQNEEMTLNIYDAAIKVWPQGEKVNNNYGAYLMSKGDMAGAITYLKTAYDISPYDLTIYKNLANFMLRIKDYQTALYFLNGAMRLASHRDADIDALFGAIYTELERCHDAMPFLESSLEIIETQSKNRMHSTNDENKIKRIKLYKELCFEGIMSNF